MMGNTNVVGAALGVGTAPRDVSGLPFLLLAWLFSTPSTTRLPLSAPSRASPSRARSS